MSIPDVPLRRARVSELHEDPTNARRHGDRNRATVNASIREFGVVQLLVVERGTGRVIGGNCTLGELRALGIEEVWVAEPAVNGTDAARLGLALNRSAELAEWDDTALSTLLAEIEAAGGKLEDIGWNADDMGDLARLIDPSDPDPAGAPDQSREIVESWRIIIECRNEAHQVELLERLAADGLSCRALVM